MTSRAWAYGLATVSVVAAALFVARSFSDVALPPPREAAQAAPAAPEDFVGADRCADCHATEYAAWTKSTHGLAGGTPSPRLVIAPFSGAPLKFADARVTPRVRAGVYEFVIEQSAEPLRTLRVDGVVGGGHIYGGGTQAFVTQHVDGTWRVLPFEWSRQQRAWFCNTNSRAGNGWAPITPATHLADCGDWPPVRVIGDLPRYANCQSCHASQATVTLDSARHGYTTRATSLAINCESCHGPGRKHVALAAGGTVPRPGDIGVAALVTLDKDASLRVCYQCHAVKDQLRPGFVSGEWLLDYYSLKFPLLGDRPLLPDGRARTFAYQEGHQFSPCYFSGGMTCTSCHDPHTQGYRSVSGVPLQGRFDNRQCTSCHVSKADRVEEHTRHPAGSSGSTCTSCHMPLRQQPDTRAANLQRPTAAAVTYARSDHTISIPRPALDSALGLASACAACHSQMSVAQQERQVREWWGELKPLNATVAAQLRSSPSLPAAEAARLLLGDERQDAGATNAFARFAGIGRFLESYVDPGVELDRDVERRLRQLAASADADLRAVALASLHLAQGDDRGVRRTLAAALRAEGPRDAALRTRWALALGFKGDQYAAAGDLDKAVTAYTRALEVHPGAARLLLSLANAQRDRGDLAGAIASYRQSVALDSRVPLAWVNLGIALGTQGDTAAAVEALAHAIALDASEPLAWFNLANIFFVRGDLERAASMYERTAALDPSIAPAHFQLARVGLLRRDERAALAHLRRGLVFDTSDASARAMAAALTGRVRR